MKSRYRKILGNFFKKNLIQKQKYQSKAKIKLQYHV